MKRKPSNHKLLKIGITGGIGSGKTTVCKMFEAFGIPVYNADERAKFLMQQEHHLIDEIKRHFGEEIYKEGKLDRPLLASKVFHDKPRLDLLNSLVHPAVFRDCERWVEQQKEKKVPYILKEAALLVETGYYKNMDKLIVVTAPLDTRLQRISERDSAEMEEIMSRVRNQMPEEDKVKLADFVVKNDGDLERLREQVGKIHQLLIDELQIVK